MSAGQDPLIVGDFAETRTEETLNAPIEWRGLPEFRPVTRDVRLVLSFDTLEQRDELIDQLGLVISKKTGPTWSAWWPPRDREDLAALRFDFGADGSASLPDATELSPEPDGEDDAPDPEPANGAEPAATAAHGQETEAIAEARRFAEARDETGNYDESGGDPF